MIRLICRQQDAAMAVNVRGASAEVTYRTVDIYAPELEAWLRACNPDSYTERSIIGAELLAEAATGEASDTGEGAR